MTDQNRKSDVWQGTMALMVLKTLAAMGPLHGYGIARRIEQISGDRLSLNYGSVYPALLRLEQERAISSEWGTSENNRKAKYYRLTAAGRRRLKEETEDGAEASSIVARFLKAKERA
jgi:PadR family transcriptional regulator, regulatory protein PadR